MKFMIVMSVVLTMLAGVAGADPIDPEPDGIGIYFDEAAGADSWCVAAAPGSQVTAYLCLTRAAVNDDTCLGGPQVATERASWGALKALYRD